MSELQKLIPGPIKGYKATNANIQCQPDPSVPPFQFEVGVWREHKGDLALCAAGFHFCEQPSGPLAHYSSLGTRIWEIEAEGVLDVPPEPGADFKRVARRIRLVREIIPTGKSNTGYRNTGKSNTGDCNTGNGNTGNCNTGDCNTGDRNTGYCNTGHRNTGDRNTGHRNTGNGNTGNGNATSYSAGFFCIEEPMAVCFDLKTALSVSEFRSKFSREINLLGSLIDAQRNPTEEEQAAILKLPNATPARLKKLLAKHKELRKETPK